MGTVTRPPREIPISARRAFGAGLIGAIGSAGLVIHIAQGIEELQQDVLTATLGVFIPVLLSVLLVAAGYWLVANRELDETYIARTAAWCALGTVVLASSGVLIILYQQAHGIVLTNRSFVLSNIGTWGASIGVLIGIYDVKTQMGTETVTEQKDRFQFLNQILRHEILNNMNIVLAKVDVLADHVDDGHQDDLDTVRKHSHDIVSLIQRVRILTKPEMRQTERNSDLIDLDAQLDRQVDQASAAYRNATFSIDGTLPDDCVVRADELLGEVFHNILHNGVRHNDSADPRIRVTTRIDGDWVRVRIADNGPGIPPDEREQVFGRGAKSDTSQGGGLGLYIVDMLVESYGGSIWVEDADLGGAAFVTELPLATPGRESEPESAIAAG